MIYFSDKDYKSDKGEYFTRVKAIDYTGYEKEYMENL